VSAQPLPRHVMREHLRTLTRYRDHVIGGTSDHDILCLIGGGSKGACVFIPDQFLEREISMALGKLERRHVGTFVPEWACEPHNVLVRAFADLIRKRRQERRP
jgi:hypothetical protein